VVTVVLLEEFSCDFNAVMCSVRLAALCLDELPCGNGKNSWRPTNHNPWRQRKHKSLYCWDCFSK